MLKKTKSLLNIREKINPSALLRQWAYKMNENFKKLWKQNAKERKWDFFKWHEDDCFSKKKLQKVSIHILLFRLNFRLKK